MTTTTTTPKHIIKPAKLTLLKAAPTEGDEPKGKDIEWTFRQTIENIIDNDPVFFRPASSARVAQRLLASFDEAEADPVWTIANGDDHEIFAKAAERWQSGVSLTRTDPKTGQVVQAKEIPARHFLPHLDAIADASVKDPRPELEAAKAPPKAEKAEAQPAEAAAPAN